jgi:hypothetical protein
LNKKPSKLHSVTSLFSEQTAIKMIQPENKTSSISPNQPKHINKGTLSDHVNLETSNAESTIMHQNDDTQTNSSPVKLISFNQLSERKPANEKISDSLSNISAESSPIIKPSSSKLKESIVISCLTFIYI